MTCSYEQREQCDHRCPPKQPCAVPQVVQHIDLL